MENKVKADLRNKMEEIADITGDLFLADNLFWSMFDLMNIPQQRKILEMALIAKKHYIDRGGKLF